MTRTMRLVISPQLAEGVRSVPGATIEVPVRLSTEGLFGGRVWVESDQPGVRPQDPQHFDFDPSGSSDDFLLKLDAVSPTVGRAWVTIHAESDDFYRMAGFFVEVLTSDSEVENR